MVAYCINLINGSFYLSDAFLGYIQSLKMVIEAYRVNPRPFRTELDHSEDSAPILGWQYRDLFTKFACKGDIQLIQTESLIRPELTRLYFSDPELRPSTKMPPNIVHLCLMNITTWFKGCFATWTPCLSGRQKVLGARLSLGISSSVFLCHHLIKTCKITASPWTSWPVTTLLTPLSTCISQTSE